MKRWARRHPRNGGKPQRFCSADCRTDYFAACRAYADQACREGRIYNVATPC